MPRKRALFPALFNLCFGKGKVRAKALVGAVQNVDALGVVYVHVVDNNVLAGTYATGLGNQRTILSRGEKLHIGGEGDSARGLSEVGGCAKGNVSQGKENTPVYKAHAIAGPGHSTGHSFRRRSVS